MPVTEGSSLKGFFLSRLYISEANMNPEKLTYSFKATQQDRHSRFLTFVFMLWFSENSSSGFSKRQCEHGPTWQEEMLCL